MSKLLSALAATTIGLLGTVTSLGDGTLVPSQRQLQLNRERLELARRRQAQHEQAIASGDLSRSPYHQFRQPYGQSGSRHDERAWYLELTANS